MSCNCKFTDFELPYTLLIKNEDFFELHIRCETSYNTRQALFAGKNQTIIHIVSEQTNPMCIINIGNGVIIPILL